MFLLRYSPLAEQPYVVLSMDSAGVITGRGQNWRRVHSGTNSAISIQCWGHGDRHNTNSYMKKCVLGATQKWNFVYIFARHWAKHFSYSHWQHNFHPDYSKVRKKQFGSVTGILIIGCALFWAGHFCWWRTLVAETFVSVNVQEIKDSMKHNSLKWWDYALLGLLPKSFFSA